MSKFRLHDLLKQLKHGKQAAPVSGSRRRIPAWSLWSGTAVAVVLLFIVIGISISPVARTVISHEEWLSPELSKANKVESKSIRIHRGDHAVSILQRLGFSLSESRQIVIAATDRYNLKDIRTGKVFKRVDSAESTDVYYNINEMAQLHLQRQIGQQEWTCNMEARTLLTRQRVVTGKIVDSLFGAADEAGMDQRTTMNLVDIFAWDIDFARDMRRGDSFSVLYEEHFGEDGRVLDTTILAAEFVNQGNHFRAVRYEKSDGTSSYFTPDGKSMRKAYLKAPVKFSRISSRFQLSRKHPILGYTRAHRGVDYAASSGTPIHAVGDGYISFIGWKHGFGRFILITHNNRNHSTAYAHMRAFARGLKRGDRVKQGQVIGYVGMSGLATGPHLHFEFRVRGVAVNPLTVKHPPARPIPAKERDRFMQQTAPLLVELNKLQSPAAWG
ncbi:peptidoglycan DD-metalloendopeptidase family protein [Mariprofundus ferrooxydans]|uniref:peptidoglycan DD-metalloendopeptidase family protein n=1 Tax=Mariprofundus ferrooxydans TaxID=314344 RepID=UPI00037EF18F|nr:peptidoglycan DD-metalloendopeptidase family protein [Mariprofundus ferrooxydans]